MATDSTLSLLSRYESRNVTFVDPDGKWPIVWERARGVHVWDDAGKRYLDLTAAFGVAAAGHANPNVVRAGQRQMAQLLHAMGDVHPHRLKALLARRLVELTFGRWLVSQSSVQDGSALPESPGRVVFGSSGFESVEVALKTARLATGKRGVIAFEGGYHGLGYGALNATFRDHFRHPFENQLGAFGAFVPFPKASGPSGLELDQTEARIRDRFQVGDVGAILVEPVQARGGIHIPPPGFLPLLRRLCDEYQALLILDEIYTGFGRTGRWFACEHSGVVPDLICLGKALTGGFPLSACVGGAEVMDAWPPSNGEAIHTSTFLGHPVGCAMALAQICEIESQQLISKSETVGQKFLQILSQLEGIYGNCKLTARGIGLMAGVELNYADGSPATRESLLLIKNLLGLGYVLLPEAAAANVISFTPPLTISLLQLRSCVRQLQQQLIQVAGSRIPHPKPSRRRSRSLP